METQRRSADASQRDAEDLTPTPTQAENDAAMLAATGGDAAPGTPPQATGTGALPHPAPLPAAHAREHEPERRDHR